MAYVKIDGYLCERCAHRWPPRSLDAPEPKVCPKCKSLHWNHPPMRPPKADPRRNVPALASKASEPPRPR